MSPEDLAAIRDRFEALHIRYFMHDHSMLIAEVERLQAALTLERQAHRLTFDIGLKCALRPEQPELTGLDKIAAWDEGMR